jgi:ABC-type transport system involved in cytochrome c biogenesis permease component
MTFLPVVTRELLARSRRPSTYWLRTGAALFAMMMAGSFLLIQRLFGGGTQFGPALFIGVSVLILVFALFEGIRNTADSLSEEKREGTLGLLFLTDLRGHDVVLGKCAATSLNSFYAVLGALPILALSLFLGGVTAGEFWRMSLVLVNCLFFAVAVGILISALSRDAGRAWAASFFLLAILIALPLVIQQLARTAGWLTPRFKLILFQAGDGAAWLSPLTSFLHVNGNQPGQFWGALIATHLIAWTFLVIASLVLPRIWHERTSRSEKGRRFGKPASPEVLEKKAAERRRLLEKHPVVWLAGRQMYQRVAMWLIPIGAVVLMILSAIWAGEMAVASWGAWPFQLAFKLLVVFQATRFFVEARNSGALELLMVTPLSAEEIVRGQLMALQRIFLGPALVLGLLPLPVAGLQFAFDFQAYAEAIMTMISGLYQLVSFFSTLLALVCVGMWMALTLRKPNAAAGLTVLAVMIVPHFLLCVPNVAIDVLLIIWAYTRLKDQLRLLAIR